MWPRSGICFLIRESVDALESNSRDARATGTKPRLWASKFEVFLLHSTNRKIEMDLPFSENVTTLSKLESVALGVNVIPKRLLDNELGISQDRGNSPVVVHSMENGIALDLGGTTRGVVDVVALESDHVVGASEVKSPVVTSVASG